MHIGRCQGLFGRLAVVGGGGCEGCAMGQAAEGDDGADIEGPGDLALLRHVGGAVCALVGAEVLRGVVARNQGPLTDEEMVRRAAALGEEIRAENVVSRANPAVVQRERDRLVELEASMAQIEERISALCG